MNLRARSSLALLALMTVVHIQGHTANITGAGSTFVYPILGKWADTYKKETGTEVNYQSIGSGSGIKQIEGKTVDFGATDMPLKSEELEKQGLVQFPLISGAVVPVVHLAGIKTDTLRLSGPVLADIFMGKIKRWNDAALTALNPGMKLPDQAIAVVHRSDGSGTSFIWTNYLSKVSSEWKEKVGENSAVQWPTGMGGKGNEGVAANVKQIDGAIGYVEFAYAKQNDMTVAQMQITKTDAKAKDVFVKADSESFTAAVASADWSTAKDYYLIITNAPGAKSWPIAGTTFVLMQKVQKDLEQGKATLKFLRWTFAKGAAEAKTLHYVPLPAAVTKMVEKTWKEQIKSADGASVAAGL